MPKVIAVCGPAGAGKSSLVAGLHRQLAGSVTLHIDDYQRITREPISKIQQWRERGADFDELEIPLVADHLKRLREGQTIVDPLSLKQLGPATCIVFETHFGRAHRDTGQYIDHLIWIDTDPDITLARNVKDLLAPMLVMGGVEPERERIAGVVSYLDKYVEEIREMRRWQREMIRPTADSLVDGHCDWSAVAAELAAQLEHSG